MRKTILLAVSLLAMGLLSCGGSESSSVVSSSEEASRSSEAQEESYSAASSEGSSSESEAASSSEAVSSSESSEAPSSSSSSESSSTGTDLGEGEVQTYYYQPNQSDFSGTGYDTTAGTTDPINGLTWSYDAFAFLGQSSDGIQIGSNKHPQETPWRLSTTFPGEVKLLGYTVALKTTVGAHYQVEAGSYLHEEDIPANAAVVEYSAEGLNEPTTSFTLSLSATSKAVYFYSLSLSLFVPDSLDLDLAGKDEDLVPAVPGENGIPATNYEEKSADEYYAGIDFGESDAELEEDLSVLVSTMTRISYGDDTEIMRYTDESVEKPGTLYGVYDGDLISGTADGTWNKEHVWPCSQMKEGGVDPRPDSDTKNHATDLHNLRVSCQNSNGKHGNKFYDVADSDIAFFPNIASDGSSNHAFEGDFRGDVARVCFYMALRYDFLKLTDDIENADDLSMGRLSVLLEWNEEDPVDAFEEQRNSRIYEYQGNRNPFIDHPELASRLYA